MISLRFLNEYLVDIILDKEEFICLQRIKWFQFIIFFIWLVGWFVLRRINPFGSFNAELNFKQFSLVWVYFCLQTVKCQSISVTSLYSSISDNSVYCPVGSGCRIHRLHLCREVTHPNECPDMTLNKSDGEVPVILGLCGIWSTPSLPLLPDPLWPGMVAPDMVLSIGLIELTAYLF